MLSGLHSTARQHAPAMTAAKGCAPPHAAQAAGQDPLAGQLTTVMLATCFDKGLIRALHDALRPDVDPRSGGHLAVHGQALLVQFVEMVPVCPMRHKVRVCDQHARRVRMGLDDSDGLTRLNHQRLIRLQVLEAGDDCVEILPCSRSATDAAIDHQFMRVLGYVGMQIVHQHPERRFCQPALGIQFRASRRKDIASVLARVAHLGLQSDSVFRMDLRCTRVRSAISGT